MKHDSETTITDRIHRYRDAQADRNQLIRDMHTAGYLKHEIAQWLNIGRTTVYRVLGARYRQDHGSERFTKPSEDRYP